MTRNEKEPATIDSPSGAEQENQGVVATAAPPQGEAGGARKRTRKATPRGNGAGRKRAPRKAAGDQVADEVQTASQAVHERLHQAEESVEALVDEVARGRERIRSAADLAEGAQEEARVVRGQVRGTAQEVAEQAGEALYQVRQARQEADLVRFEAGQVHQEVEQVRQELEEVRRQHRDTGLMVAEALRDADETVNQLELARQFQDEARRQLEVVRLQVVEARSYLETVQKECQTASQILQEEIRQQLDETRRRSREVSHDLEESSRQARVRLDEMQGELEAAHKSWQEAPPATAPAERVLRHLHLAWSLEDAVADALHVMHDEVVDRDLHAALAEQRRLTEKQKQELEARLRALGGEPVAGKGVLQRLAGWLWEGWKREPDDCDRALQDLVKALTAQQAEVTIAQMLAVLATAGGDRETAELALRQRAEKQEAVDRLQQLIAPLAELAVRLPATAREAAQQLLVEAGVTEPPPEPAATQENTTT
jgi:hypothetical protein